MNDRQRIRLAQAVAARTELLARTLDAVVDGTTVLGRMRDCQGPLRAKTYDATPSTIRHDGSAGGVDQATRDEHDLDATLKHASVAITKAWEIVGRYPPPHRANDADRVALGKANARPEPGCESCARTESAAGGPRWEPPRSGQANATTVGGRLAEPKLLCEWCYQCVRRWGRLPTVAELERHHRGEIVPWPADVKRPQ